MRNLCVITGHYPTEANPKYTFVDQLVCQFADMGIKCTVICPSSLSQNLLKKAPESQKRWVRKTLKGNEIDIICPSYFSFSSKKTLAFNTAKWTLASFARAALKAYNAENQKFDAVYGHFIFPSAIVASLITKRYKVPSFLAYGENTTYTIDCLGAQKTAEAISPLSGIISVSTVNKSVLIEHKIAEDDKIEVLPNGIEPELFYKRDKAEMRAKYNLPKNDFIVAFVGGFIHIKGADRLSAAIEKIGSDKIKSIFVGKGEIVPTCGGILLQGTQPHKNIPEILSAADIFVLPTLAEGCCNAIIEAMACGLPVVSSNLPFNDDILDETCSIRVDTSDPDQIAAAISKLYGDPSLREKMSRAALEKASGLTLGARAEKIIAFINSKIR